MELENLPFGFTLAAVACCNICLCNMVLSASQEGQGILTSDGESWLIQRKTAALEFTTRTLRQATGRWGNRTNKNRLWCILDKASNEKKAMDLQDLGYPKGVTASEDEV
ncbi:hypothetical protein Godav_025554 [Gossypium davidsonii]|uniref:Uncharacterized protein n=1 Tax=Gossypium davidsonii TaxID=34287 RepID=A0A7J8TGG3_GOSDV|nr:hypothetical protein [Gossypium davidsonii]